MSYTTIERPFGAPPMATTAEVIDAYANGELTPAARRAVEMIFLAAAQHAMTVAGHAAPVAELICAPELRAYWIETLG